jgi:hypothetical protein
VALRARQVLERVRPVLRWEPVRHVRLGLERVRPVLRELERVHHVLRELERDHHERDRVRHGLPVRDLRLFEGFFGEKKKRKEKRDESMTSSPQQEKKKKKEKEKKKKKTYLERPENKCQKHHGPLLQRDQKE